MNVGFLLITVLLYFGVVYLIGSIPTGYWLAKKLKGIDIRNEGSGSTGATNVYRCVGRTAGISVFLIDFLKGYLPVVVAGWLSDFCGYRHLPDGTCVHDRIDVYSLLPVFTAATVLIGHSRSVFLGFKGGKSAATGLGTLFALDWRVGSATFLFWMIVLYIGRIVSIASILATAICIPFMVLFCPKQSYIGYCILGFAYVTLRHKANIERILAGTEPKIGGKSA